jgi:hypothetical protein
MRPRRSPRSSAATQTSGSVDGPAATRRRSQRAGSIGQRQRSPFERIVRSLARSGLDQRSGERAAEPISSVLPLSRDQVEAVIGGILLALVVYRFAKTMARVWRAGQESAAA